MCDERPVQFKKLKLSTPDSEISKTCVVHIEPCLDMDTVKSLSDCTVTTIQNARHVRQSLFDPKKRMDFVCENLPSIFNFEVHGFHRSCYQKFTSTSRLIPVSLETGNAKNISSTMPCEQSTSSRDVKATVTRRSSSVVTSRDSNNTRLFPQNKCIFCNTGESKKAKGSTGTGKGPLVKCVTNESEQTIKRIAEKKSDFALLGLIAGESMIAREARYHERCRKIYTKVMQADEPDNVSPSEVKRSANKEAFSFICDYIQINIIERGLVERMTMLKNRYMSYVEENWPEFYNPEFQTHVLKEKIADKFKSQLTFAACGSGGHIVFSSLMNVCDAVTTAFSALTSENKIIKDAALILRSRIRFAHTNSKEKEFDWPPNQTGIEEQRTELLPMALLDFLSTTVSIKPFDKASTKVRRVSLSIAEDVCSAVTRGRWKMNKHLFLGYTLRRLTGREDIVTLINRFGHCSSYSSIMELENAIARKVDIQDSVLPSNIVPCNNRVAHLVWDNFDLNEETPTGHGTSHTTHGIVVQELADPQILTSFENISVPRSRKAYKIQPEVLQTTHIPKRCEPLLNGTLSESEFAISPDSSNNTIFSDSAWIVCRRFFNNGQSVSDWGGWVSLTGKPQKNVNVKSIVGYMRPILQPITSYDTVHHCLLQSMEISKSLHQDYTFVTMDLAAAKLAYDVVWSNVQRFPKVIILLGPFHIMCSYLSALGKMVAGSGFEEIVLEAGIIASGSLGQVMAGKHFNRAMTVHQRVLESLEHLLLQHFNDSFGDFTSGMTAFQDLGECPSHEKLLKVFQDEICQEFVAKYEGFKETIRSGERGKTAQFWLQYMDAVWLLLCFHRSVKLNDFQLFTTCLGKMCGMIFAADHLHYGRYLPFYYVQMKSLFSTHPIAERMLREEGFTACRSPVPGSRVALDMTIEQTINKSAKSSGGIVGFSRNSSAYTRWCLTRHAGAGYVEATLDAAELTTPSVDSHKSLLTANKVRSARDVEKLSTTIKHFMDPFNDTSARHQLYCLASGKSASAEVSNDLLHFFSRGRDAANEFIKTRLINRTLNFQAPMKKLKLSTFTSMAVKTEITCARKKVLQIKAERNVFGQLLVASQKNNVSLDKVLEYPLGPVPWALATADGCIAKTNKAQLANLLESSYVCQDTVEVPVLESSVYVIDGNALLQCLIAIPDTFEELALYVFNLLPRSPVLHFVMDMYWERSIKNVERDRRGQGEILHIEGSKMKVPKDFKKFLMCGGNKKRLAEILLFEWTDPKYAARFQGRTIYFVCAAESLTKLVCHVQDHKSFLLMQVPNLAACVKLQSIDGYCVDIHYESLLLSTHEEADTRLILHSVHAATNGTSPCTVVVRSPDTDVFVLLLSFAKAINSALLFETGVGNKRRLIDIQSLAKVIGPSIVDALPGFHAFTGCDSVSSFVRKGKRLPFKLLKKSKSYQEAFSTLGDAVVVSEDLFNVLQEFVCEMYGCSSEVFVNDARSSLFQTRYAGKGKLSLNGGIDISLLPPCETSLRLHTKRANYQSYLWRHADVSMLAIPSPYEHGWENDGDGGIKINWTGGVTIPQVLAEIMCESTDSTRVVQVSHHNHDSETAVLEVFGEVEEDDVVDNIVDFVYDSDSDDGEDKELTLNT